MHTSERRQWKGLSCFVCVEAIRTQQGKTSVERHYYLSSLKEISAREFLTLIRGTGPLKTNCTGLWMLALEKTLSYSQRTYRYCSKTANLGQEPLPVSNHS